MLFRNTQYLENLVLHTVKFITFEDRMLFRKIWFNNKTKKTATPLLAKIRRYGSGNYR